MSEANATTAAPQGQPAPATAGPTGDAKVKANTMAAMQARVEAAPVSQGSAPLKGPVILANARMKEFQYENNNHAVTVESTTKYSDLFDPIFWSSVAPQLRMYDEISVRVDDGAWYAKLLVVQCGPAHAFVTELMHKQLRDEAEIIEQSGFTDKYDIRLLGPYRKWCVIRKADKAVIQEKMPDQGSALRWAEEYEQRTARAIAA